MTESFATTWKEIATSFLKIGTTAYGGPAIMGVMQAEIQERRQWTSKPRFLEGLGLVNVLPGATMVQLAIFLGYQRAGWWGGLLAGLCFTAPAFVVMLVLAAAYATFGVSPLLRGALYGLGPVVLAIFVSAVFRLGKSALRSRTHALIAAGAAVAAAASFVPSFVMMLALLPLFDRVRNLAWARAVIQGIVPGVVGVMAVALVRMAPYAAPDAPAIAVLVVTAAALVVWRLAPLKVMGSGTVFGILRTAVRA